MKEVFLYFSDRAYEKMRKLKISQGQVVDCIKNGVLVEQQSGYDNEDQGWFFIMVMRIVLCCCNCNGDGSFSYNRLPNRFYKMEEKGDGIERIK